MWQNYYSVNSVEKVLDILAEKGNNARIIAGATDLMLEIERGVRRGIETLIDITRIPGLNQIMLDETGLIHLGPLVTHNQCVNSKLLVEQAFPLARAAWEVGAPQIRNRGTVAGNLITASPANDTITPLMALGASVVLRSAAGTRTVPLEKFYTGVRRTVMQADEMLVDIHFRALSPNQCGTFIKIGLRRAQAISVVNAAVVLTMDGPIVRQAMITLGSVAPTIVRAREAEASLIGKALDEEAVQQAAHLAQLSARPIDDVRGSAGYRLEMTRVAVLRALGMLAVNREKEDFPAQPVLLWGSRLRDQAPVLQDEVKHTGSEVPASEGTGATPIVTTINGKKYSLRSGHDKSLLHLLREQAGLFGTKEGCAEGECGACTVILDGMAVMSCLVPAPRAHGAEIITVEGLAQDGHLHPVQQAFMDAGAVQCGYCTPGFLMSSVVLLDEYAKPTREQIMQSMTGNLCRCTGYYKIIEAVEAAIQAKVISP